MTRCVRCSSRLIGSRITLEFCNKGCYKTWLLELGINLEKIGELLSEWID